MIRRILWSLLPCLGFAFITPAIAQDAPQSDALPEQAEIGQPENTQEPPALVPVRNDPALPDLRPDVIPTAAFATRSQMSDAKLSPGGSKFAYEITSDGRARIAIFDGDTRAAIATIDVGDAPALRWFRWAGENRILFSLRVRALIGLNSLPASRLMVYDLGTRQTHYVGLGNQGVDGDSVLHVDPAGEFVILSLGDRAFSDPSVYRFQLDGSGEDGATLLEQRRNGIDEWRTDHRGVVRLGLRAAGKRTPSYFYRASADEEYIEITEITLDGEIVDVWAIVRIDADSDSGHVMIEDARGLDVLHEFDFRSGTVGELVYAHSDWGLQGAYVEYDGSLSGTHYVDDFHRSHWFDADMARHQSRLERSLGEGRVKILSRATTDRMLVWHGGGNDPGVIYVYTPSRNKLDVFGELRPDVDFKQLAIPQAVTYSARDGTPIPAYLTLPRERGAGNFPLIVNPHGGPYGVRSTLAYNDEVQMLANRGYAVLQPNFRGSDGFGRDFEKLGHGQIGRAMQDDIDDATDWAVAQGYADPERVCVVGGSYGGYTALWAVIRNPERYRCAASWAGVTDFEAQRRWTHDKLPRRERGEWIEQITGEDAEFDFETVSPVQQIERLTRPILIAHGRDDRIVPFSQFSAMRRAARAEEKDFEELEIEGEGHSFSDPANEKAWYDAMLGFLAKHNPSDLNTPELFHEQMRLDEERAAELAQIEQERADEESRQQQAIREEAERIAEVVDDIATEAVESKLTEPVALDDSVEDDAETSPPE